MSFPPRALTLPALAIAMSAVAGCGRAAPPPARRVPAAPAPPTSAETWLESREPGDRCRREDERPHPKYSYGGIAQEDLSHGLAFLCTLHGRHAARLVVEGGNYGNPEAVIVHDPPADTAGGDTLLLGESEPPYAGATLLEGEDLDGDGWTDVRVMTFHGSGGHMYDVFRYQPARHRFQKDTVLSGGGNLSASSPGCVRTSWRMGIGNSSWEERCWRSGRWVVTQAWSSERADSLSTADVQVTIQEKRVLRDGRLRRVSLDTVRERP